MSPLALGLVFAVIASLALNGSYLLQAAGSATAPDVDPRRPLATIIGLLRSRLWTLGAVLGVTGWGIHVLALSHAPLSLVQAFVAGAMGLMAPFAARLLRQTLTPREWLAVGGVAVALVLVTVGIHEHGAHSTARPAAMWAFVAAAIATAAALAAFARSWRAHALGLAGGILYGAADTAVKALTGVASAHGIAGVATSPWLPCAAVTTIAAFFAFQRGLQTGRAVPVVVLMTGATTVVSVAGAFAVFGDPLGRTPLLAYLHVAGFALVTVASALLAPLAHVPEPEAATTVAPPRPLILVAGGLDASADDADDDGPYARPVIEVEQRNLLPRP